MQGEGHRHRDQVLPGEGLVTGPAQLTHHQQSSLVTGNNGRPDQGIITWDVSKPVREVKKPHQRSKELHAFRIFLSHAEAWGGSPNFCSNRQDSCIAPLKEQRGGMRWRKDWGRLRPPTTMSRVTHRKQQHTTALPWAKAQARL